MATLRTRHERQAEPGASAGVTGFAGGTAELSRRWAAEETSSPNQHTLEVHMKRVTGIGGIFFKAKDAPALQAWYKRHLGIDVQEWGGTAFTWADSDGKPTGGTTVWSVGPEEGDQFAPSRASFMVNYRVEDLHALVAALKAEGCNVLERIDDPGKLAELRLIDLVEDVAAFCFERRDHSVKVFNAVVDHERSFAWSKLVAFLRTNGPDGCAACGLAIRVGQSERGT
ncbi:MAG TPA: hypothetical protein VKE24_02630, partial [Candidatus Acidoferrales bacterium]|nr:hypothetical protein [Candidatus Acidoferrales bacterium]